MRSIALLIFILISVGSCKKPEQKPFDSFDYSFEGTFSELFSIKFSQNDTVYIRYLFIAGKFDETTTVPKVNTTYVGILNDDRKEMFFDYISKIDFKKFDDEYYDRYVDGSSYRLYYKKNSIEKSIYVHSNTKPKELDSLSKLIHYLKNELALKETKKVVQFESLKNFISIPPPPKK